MCAYPPPHTHIYLNKYKINFKSTENCSHKFLKSTVINDQLPLLAYHSPDLAEKSLGRGGSLEIVLWGQVQSSLSGYHLLSPVTNTKYKSPAAVQSSCQTPHMNQQRHFNSKETARLASQAEAADVARILWNLMRSSLGRQQLSFSH